MSVAQLENVVERLEKVATKLETISVGKGGDDGCAFIEAFDALITGPVAGFCATSNRIGGEVATVGNLIEKGFSITKRILTVVAASKKPSNERLAHILQPLAVFIDEAKTFADKNFKSHFKSHLDAMSAFCPCFGWLQAPGKPSNFIAETIDSGMFYANRVLTGFKDKGEDHRVWVRELRKCFDELKQYVQDYHSMGCSWNPKGVEASAPAVQPEASKTVAAPAASTPRPAQPSVGALFAAINQGTGITGGLKKVDDSQKTHKNPNLRANATVSSAPKGASTTSAATKSTETKPPVFVLESKKWMIEYQRNVQMLDLNEGDISYSAYVHRCTNTNIMVHKKINVITFDNCHNCKVQLKSGLISSVEVTNCKKIEIHADDVLPFVNINSTDGCQVYLTSKSKGCKVCTSVSNTVNVCLWADDGELTEYPVPHVFTSFIKDNKLMTEIEESV